MKKKILLITQPYVGGGERMTLLYGKILEKSGFDIDLLILKLTHNKDNSLDAFIPENWHKMIIESKYRYFPIELLRYIRKTNPNVVFSSNVGFSLMLLFIKKYHLASVKIAIRDCNMPATHKKWEVLFSRWLYPEADIMISQTLEMKDEMIKFYHLNQDDITVINNPIDKELIISSVKESYAFDKSYINYVGIGRIAKQKDFITMITAFRIVLKSNPQSRLYIIGEVKNQAIKNELDEYIEKNKLKGYVIFEGFQSNPFKYLIGCDVFCLSSIYEGLPNVMLEAMFLGKPVAVTHSVPFISQIVENGKNGYTCDIQNPHDFAKCMLKAKDLKKLPMYKDVVESEEKIINIFSKL